MVMGSEISLSLSLSLLMVWNFLYLLIKVFMASGIEEMNRVHGSLGSRVSIMYTIIAASHSTHDLSTLPLWILHTSLIILSNHLQLLVWTYEFDDLFPKQCLYCMTLGSQHSYIFAIKKSMLCFSFFRLYYRLEGWVVATPQVLPP